MRTNETEHAMHSEQREQMTQTNPSRQEAAIHSDEKVSQALAWSAGFFDGEGCLMLLKSCNDGGIGANSQPRGHSQPNDLSTLNALQDRIGVHTKPNQQSGAGYAQ